MRKIFILLLALLLSQEALFAQDTGEDAWRPDPGDFIIEITGNPFNSSSFLALDFGQFRGRYFLTEKLVPRLGFQMDLNNDQNTPDVVTNVSGFTVMPGLEYHLTNEGKFSSYVAFDAIIGNRSSSSKSTNGETILGATYFDASSSPIGFANRGFFEIGAQLSIGADYYFNSRFYVGVEVGYTLNSMKYNEIYVDGELMQQSTVSKYGDQNISNAFRFGFLLF
jgi:hypothetical protein